MSLFAGNVSHRASADDVRSFFAKFGPCRVDVKRGYAFIDYDNDRDAEDARNDTNGRDFHGMKLNVEWSKKHIARTGGATGPGSEWERRRSRYADDRRYRPYDRDYDRDYRRRNEFDRYDGERNRDYNPRGKDSDRGHDRNRDDVSRFDRPRDWDRGDSYRERDYYDRDDRYDRGRGDPGRSRERSRERGQEYRRMSEGDSDRDDRKSARNGGDHRRGEERDYGSQARAGDDRDRRNNENDVGNGKHRDDLVGIDANGNGREGTGANYERHRDVVHHGRRSRTEDDDPDRGNHSDLGSERKRAKRETSPERREYDLDDRRDRRTDERDPNQGSKDSNADQGSEDFRNDQNLGGTGETESREKADVDDSMRGSSEVGRSAIDNGVSVRRDAEDDGRT